MQSNFASPRLEQCKAHPEAEGKIVLLRMINKKKFCCLTSWKIKKIKQTRLIKHLFAYPVLVHHTSGPHCKIINNFDAGEQGKAEEKSSDAAE